MNTVIPENLIGKSNDIAHFFNDKATSTFIIKRTGKKVTASYHGRNETPNTTETSLVDTLRNTVVAIAAGAGFSRLQWSPLIKGFLQDEGHLS